MSVGLEVNKANLDARVGNLAWMFRQQLAEIQLVKAWLDGKTEQDLVALGYTVDEVAVMKSAFTDLGKLALIAHGQATQAEANDFFFWASKLTGTQ